MAVKSVSIRIEEEMLKNEEEMLKKLTYVADYEGRSLNSHLLVLIRNSIKAFEAEHPAGFDPQQHQSFRGGARPHRRAHRPGAQRQTRQTPVSRNNTPRHLPGRAAENFPLL